MRKSSRTTSRTTSNCTTWSVIAGSRISDSIGQEQSHIRGIYREALNVLSTFSTQSVISPDRGRPSAFGRGRRPPTVFIGRCWTHSSYRWCPSHTNVCLISLLHVTTHTFGAFGHYWTPLDSATEGRWTPVDMVRQVHRPPMDLTKCSNGCQLTPADTCKQTLFGH